MRTFMSPGRGAASPRATHIPTGGLSMAFGGDSSGKKRGLASLSIGAPSSDSLTAAAAAGGGVEARQQQHQLLPKGGLSSALGSGTFSSSSSGLGGGGGGGHLSAALGSGNYSAYSTGSAEQGGSGDGMSTSPAASALAAVSTPLASTPHSQPSPLSEALAVSGQQPRRKVPRHGSATASSPSVGDGALSATLTSASAVTEHGGLFGGSVSKPFAGGSDDSDGDECSVPGSLPAASGGWAIAGAPPHLMSSGAMSLPHHAGGMDMFANGFRPGSVMEGAGRKLRGTEAMRVRNAVLRQTGFLEPEPDNLFADHTEGSPVSTVLSG